MKKKENRSRSIEELQGKLPPGSIVRCWNRLWILLPESDSDLQTLRPLLGNEAEAVTLWDQALIQPVIRPDKFPLPRLDVHLADFASAQLLMDAARLLVRDAAGPFRSVTRLAFRPRAYQFVPLLLALRQLKSNRPIRLLIADDVGIGKTVEALIIARELYDRYLIRRLAVICPPHLCEQWQAELRDKFGLQAEVLRATTIGRLERQYPGGGMHLLGRVPIQVISVDYLKGKADNDQLMQIFTSQGPELVIVDEAHSCAKPESAVSANQHQRYRLLNHLARHEQRPKHLILLTATPHSGKAAEFRSLLALLHPDLENYDPAIEAHSDGGNVGLLANHFIQRRREDVQAQSSEDSNLFPKRVSSDQKYELTPNYERLYYRLIDWARLEMKDKPSGSAIDAKTKFRYWTLLAILRGALSSPEAGLAMVQNRLRSTQVPDSVDDHLLSSATNPHGDSDEGFDSDAEPAFADQPTLADPSKALLESIADQLAKIAQFDQDGKALEDGKAQKARTVLFEWLQRDIQPIVFCRYIKTAHYLKRLLEPALKKYFPELQVEVITSEMNEEQRRERIRDLGAAPKRLLIATDCLSEGINLQEFFTGVLHYDLPWNPNRLEQREGRIDRYGQTAPEVHTAMLIGENNPVDHIIYGVLLKKVEQIRRDSGIVIPFAESDRSIVDEMLKVIVEDPRFTWQKGPGKQTSLQLDDYKLSSQLSQRFQDAEKASATEKRLRKKLAHLQDAARLELTQELEELDRLLGTPKTVEQLVRAYLSRKQVTIKDGPHRTFTFSRPNFDSRHPDYRVFCSLPEGPVRYSCYSPTPPQTVYLGRNHPFVELAARQLIDQAYREANIAPSKDLLTARLAVVRTRTVSRRTIVALLRLRLLIQPKSGGKPLYAEEIFPWAFIPPDNPDKPFEVLDQEAARKLFESATSDQPVPQDQQRWLLEPVLGWFAAAQTGENIKAVSDPDARQLTRWLTQHLPRQRTKHLIDRYRRQANLLDESAYRPFGSWVPADALGIYLLLPALSG